MSWDLVLLKVPEGSRPSEADWGAAGLGPRAAAVTRLRESFPAIDLRDPSWGVVEGDGFSIEVSLGASDPLGPVMLHVRGGGGAVEAILRLCRAAGWRALDLNEDAFLDAMPDPAAGQRAFQELLGAVKQAIGAGGGKVLAAAGLPPRAARTPLQRAQGLQARGEHRAAAAVFEEVLATAGADADLRAQALGGRARARRVAGDAAGALADWDAIAAMEGAHPDQRAGARLAAGAARAQAGDAAGAEADCTAVLAMDGVCAEHRARARLDRAAGRTLGGRLDEALADLEAFEPWSGETPGKRALATAHRGLAAAQIGRIRYLRGEHEASAEATRRAMADLPRNARASGNLALALLHLGRADEAREAALQSVRWLPRGKAGAAEAERGLLADLRAAIARAPELPGALPLLAELEREVETRKDLRVPAARELLAGFVRDVKAGKGGRRGGTPGR